MANESLRFPLLLVSCWRVRMCVCAPGRKCPSFGVEEIGNPTFKVDVGEAQ